MLSKVLKNLSIYLLIVLVIIMLIKYTQPPNTGMEEWTYNRFFQAVNQGQVQEVTIQSREHTNLITGTTKNGTRFQVTGLKNDAQIATFLLEKGVEVKIQEPPSPGWWANILTSLLPILIFVLLFFFMMQQTQGGGNRVMSFGKSRARLHTDDKKTGNLCRCGGCR